MRSRSIAEKNSISEAVKEIVLSPYGNIGSQYDFKKASRSRVFCEINLIHRDLVPNHPINLFKPSSVPGENSDVVQTKPQLNNHLCLFQKHQWKIVIVALCGKVVQKAMLCSHSPNDVPPEPQWNVPIAAVRGAVRPSNNWQKAIIVFRKSIPC